MTCGVLQVGGGVGRVRSGCLRRCRSLVVAAAEAGDEGDLLRAGRTRTRPRLGARLRLGPEGDRTNETEVQTHVRARHTG